MLDTIVHAAENFLTHQLELTATAAERPDAMRTVIAYIDTESQTGRHHRVYVACNGTLIARIIELFLGEEEDDEATRTDMALETANLVVGSAKVIAQERGEVPFTIGTPHFVKDAPFDMLCDSVRELGGDGCMMIIGIKEQ
jgi:hypothetical protein